MLSIKCCPLNMLSKKCNNCCNTNIQNAILKMQCCILIIQINLTCVLIWIWYSSISRISSICSIFTIGRMACVVWIGICTIFTIGRMACVVWIVVVAAEHAWGWLNKQNFVFHWKTLHSITCHSQRLPVFTCIFTQSFTTCILHNIQTGDPIYHMICYKEVYLPTVR